MIINNKERAEMLRQLSGTNVSLCIQCGRCSANCPVAWKMDVLPHRFVYELLNGGNVDVLLEAKSPWKCLSCFSCAERCPKGVSPAAIMEAVRLTHIRAQGNNKLNPADLENYDDKMPQQAIVAAFRKFNK